MAAHYTTDLGKGGASGGVSALPAPGPDLSVSTRPHRGLEHTCGRPDLPLPLLGVRPRLGHRVRGDAMKHPPISDDETRMFKVTGRGAVGERKEVGRSEGCAVGLTTYPTTRPACDGGHNLVEGAAYGSSSVR